MEERKKDNRKTVIKVEIVLIIILLLLFLFIKSLGLIEHKSLVPTGNVDIFDIILLPSCTTGEDEATDKDGNNQYGTASTSKEETKKGGITVYDDDGVYSKQKKLNIFTKPSYYVVDNKIAPTSENSYQFVIRNNSNFTVKYSLNMIEKNEHNINMKYRLKVNGKYVVGNDDNYVTADKLARYDLKLDTKKYDTYTLDWKWFEGNNDTEIGSNIDSYYQLTVKITATEY